MNKRLLSLVTIIVFLFSTTAFAAYQWEQIGNDWYVREGETFLKSRIVNTGSNVYYLDNEGKMCVGWYMHPDTKKIYFFDNNEERALGTMIFGLHTIDGYYRYFYDDGSLAVAREGEEYSKVYQEFWADAKGNLYFANQLMRDVTIAKSEYYTNIFYYKNESLNNYYLANLDTVSVIDIEKNIGAVMSSNSEGSDIRGTKTATQDANKSKQDKGVAHGGTNYEVIDGKVVVYDKEPETSEFEKYGPGHGEGGTLEGANVIGPIAK